MTIAEEPVATVMRPPRAAAPLRLNVLEYMGTRGMGGVENHVLSLCEQLDPRQFNVTISCATEDRGELLHRAFAAGVRVHGFPSRGHGKLSYLKRTLALARV